MKGIVVHYQGKVRRALEGRINERRLEVRVANPVSRQTAEAGSMLAISQPIYFVFDSDGRRFAASHNVSISMGRRYPEVEHWFVVPEHEQPADIYEPQITSSPTSATSAV